MTNALKKSTGISIIPEQAAQAAIPYRPAQPARTVTERKTACHIEVTLVGARAPSTVPIRDENNQIIGYENDPGSPGTLVKKRVCVDWEEIVHYPALPEQQAVPAVEYRPRTVVQAFKLGWNAGARSIDQITANGAATFSVPTAVGVVVGFNGFDEGAGYFDIEHGIYFRRHTFQVIESGVSKGSEHTFESADVFMIERIGDRVRYYQNDTPVYTSLDPSYGAVFLDASMYSGGDTVDSPELIESIGGYSTASMRPMDGFASETEWNYSRGVMLAMSGAASALRARSHGVMLPMTGLAVVGKYGESRAAMRPMSGVATGGMLAPAYALSAAQMMPMYGAAYGPEARYGFSSAIMIPMTGMAVVGKYGESRASMAAMQGYAVDRRQIVFPAILGGSISHFAIVTLSTEPMVAVLSGSITAGQGQATLPTQPMALVLDGEIAQFAEATLATAVMRGILSGEISSVADVVLQTFPIVALLGGRLGNLSQTEGATEVFVLNITGGKPGGTTKYDNYSFNSVAKIGDNYYGASPDGIFILDGNDDYGQPISAKFGFGKSDFGSPKLKTISYCYLGASAGGIQLSIESMVDGRKAEYSYITRCHDSEMRDLRFDIGRGLSSSYIIPTFYNIDGDDFEIDAVRFIIAESARRI